MLHEIPINEPHGLLLTHHYTHMILTLYIIRVTLLIMQLRFVQEIIFGLKLFIEKLCVFTQNKTWLEALKIKDIKNYFKDA